MSRGIYVYRNGKIVPKHSAPPRYSNAKMRQVISDDLGGDLEHMAYGDGRRTASKSVYRRWTREAGCVEKGNDREAPHEAATDNYRSDVIEAIRKVNAGYRPIIRRKDD